MTALLDIGLPQHKCCAAGFSLTNNFLCTRTSENDSYEIHDHYARNFRRMEYKCPEDYDVVYSFGADNLTLTLCSDLLVNGSAVFANCENSATSRIVAMMRSWNPQFSMFCNVAQILFCLAIVSIYYFLPKLYENLNNRAIMRHYISLLCTGLAFTILRSFNLCECSINETVLTLIWLALQYFTMATVLWINVICWDLTSLVTKFEVPRNNYNDDIRLRNYAIFAWGVAVLPVLFVAFFEFAPVVPEDYFLEPKNFTNGSEQWIFYCYFILPALSLLFNNLFFIYTSYKMIRIKHSTTIGRKNQMKDLRKSYMVFVKLYLMMAAPWFFVYAYAFLSNYLAILKICHVLQPFVWLMSLICNKKVRKGILVKIGLIRRIEPGLEGDVKDHSDSIY